MSKEAYSEDCAGCQPALVHVETGKVMAADTPVMKAMLRVWREASLIERLAYHEVCCRNSRAPGQMELALRLVTKMQQAMVACRSDA